MLPTGIARRDRPRPRAVPRSGNRFASRYPPAPTGAGGAGDQRIRHGDFCQPRKITVVPDSSRSQVCSHRLSPRRPAHRKWRRPRPRSTCCLIVRNAPSFARLQHYRSNGRIRVGRSDLMVALSLARFVRSARLRSLDGTGATRIGSWCYRQICGLRHPGLRHFRAGIRAAPQSQRPRSRRRGRDPHTGPGRRTGVRHHRGSLDPGRGLPLSDRAHRQSDDRIRGRRVPARSRDLDRAVHGPARGRGAHRRRCRGVRRRARLGAGGVVDQPRRCSRSAPPPREQARAARAVPRALDGYTRCRVPHVARRHRSVRGRRDLSGGGEARRRRSPRRDAGARRVDTVLVRGRAPRSCGDVVEPGRRDAAGVHPRRSRRRLDLSRVLRRELGVPGRFHRSEVSLLAAVFRCHELRGASSRTRSSSRSRSSSCAASVTAASSTWTGDSIVATGATDCSIAIRASARSSVCSRTPPASMSCARNISISPDEQFRRLRRSTAAASSSRTATCPRCSPISDCDRSPTRFRTRRVASSPAWFAWDDPLPFVSMTVRLAGPLTRGVGRVTQSLRARARR